MCLSVLGHETILLSKAMPSLLMYKVEAGKVIDRLSVVPLVYDLNSDIGKRIFREGAFEEFEISYFENAIEALNRNSTIIDVGANIGVHSIRWAEGNSNVEVYAFEPSRDTAAILEKNIALNQLEAKVHVVRNAVSDHAGEATFYECEDNAFSSLKDTHRKKIINSTVVQVTTIDKFVENTGIVNLDLLKIDVEGFETEVIQGAKQTLERLAPDLFVEIYGGASSNPNPEGTVKLIMSLGYNAFVLSQGKISKYVKHNDGKYNYYFTKRTI